MKKFILFSLVILSMSANAYVYVEHCANYSDKVDYSFISCINRNFDSLETEINLNREQQVFLNYCSNYGDKLDYTFQSCVNENFRTMGRAIDGYFGHCSNYKDKGVDYFYTSCLNNNFQSAARILDKSVE